MTNSETRWDKPGETSSTPRYWPRSLHAPNSRKKVLQRLRDYEDSSHALGLYDEQVWTLLFTYGFVADRNRDRLFRFYPAC